MKHRFVKFITGLFLLAFFALNTGCALIVEDVNQPYHPRHRQRVVWVSGVAYRQVYYIQNRNVVVVSQVQEQQKPHKVKRIKSNNGNNGNGNNGNHGHGH